MPDRALSSLYVRVNGHGMLIDCGEGTQVGIRRCGWGFKNIDCMLLTHFHGDHVTGIPGFLMSMDKANRTEPFHIYGPKGLKYVVEGLCVVAPHLGFQVVLHETEAYSQFSALGMDVTAIPLNHGVPCLGYHFSLKRSPQFDPVKAQALDIPVKYWSRLQHGERIVTCDGQEFLPEMVLGQSRRGLSFVYATDTRPVAALEDFGAYSDLMVLEGMYGDDDKAEQAAKNRHMIFHEAAQIARDAGSKRLILTHFSTSITDPEEFLPNAADIFPETACACDGMTISLEYE